MPKKTDPVIRILTLFVRRGGVAVTLFALVTVASALDIAIPFITRRLVDSLVKFFQHSAGNPIPVLLGSGAAILAATGMGRAMRSLYNYHLFRAATSVEDQIRQAAFENYLRLDAGYHHNANSGQIMGRIDRGATAVFTIVYEIAGQSMVPPLVVFSGVLISLLFTNPWIALAVFLPLPVYLLAVRRLTGRIYEIEQETSADFEAVAKEGYDVASNVTTVKKFSRERAEVATQKRLQDHARRTQYSGERLWAYIENTQSLVAAAGRVMVLMLAGFMVLKHRSTVGEFVLFVALQDMAYAPLASLSVIFPRLRRAASRAERLLDVVDEPVVLKDRPDAMELPALQHSIEFDNVWFRYSPEARWTLKGVNLRIPAGSTVALVGRSGSGKTTLTNLLLRAFDPQRGAIRIDGVDIRDVTQRSLRRQMAVVPQEVDLFSRSIHENICYSKAGATRAEVVQAARTSLAHDFILRTEEGYETVVGERGVKLSGGERQRIGIARAVLRDPRILILDEATSHLDNESEQLIQKATEQVVRNRTSFVIAHRLSTVVHADMTVVFNEGEIEATGTHETLLDSSPTYRRLYELHAGAAEEPEQHLEELAAVSGD